MRVHSAFDLDYVLRLPQQDAARLLKDARGRLLTSAEVKAHAAILKARGFEVMPVGCDNYDGRGYCKGHTDERVLCCDEGETTKPTPGA